MTQQTDQIYLNRRVNELKHIERMLLRFPNNISPHQMSADHAMLMNDSTKLRNNIIKQAKSTYQPNPIEHDFELQSNARTIKPLYNQLQKNQSLSANDRHGTSYNKFNPQSMFATNARQKGVAKRNRRQVSPEEWSKACESIKPNGCGSKANLFSFLIPNRLDGFDFTLACNAHDQNYSTLGVSFEAANRRFYEDMMVAVRAIANPGTAKYRQGESLARLYYDKVVSQGRSSYNEAQKNAYICKYGERPK